MVMQLSFEDNYKTISQKFIQDTSLVTHKFGNAFELGFELRSQRFRAWPRAPGSEITHIGEQNDQMHRTMFCHLVFGEVVIRQ